jgi:hypothetical protein
MAFFLSLLVGRSRSAPGAGVRLGGSARRGLLALSAAEAPTPARTPFRTPVAIEFSDGIANVTADQSPIHVTESGTIQAADGGPLVLDVLVVGDGANEISVWATDTEVSGLLFLDAGTSLRPTSAAIRIGPNTAVVFRAPDGAASVAAFGTLDLGAVQPGLGLPESVTLLVGKSIVALGIVAEKVIVQGSGFAELCEEWRAKAESSLDDELTEIYCETGESERRALIPDNITTLVIRGKGNGNNDNQDKKVVPTPSSTLEPDATRVRVAIAVVVVVSTILVVAILYTVISKGQLEESPAKVATPEADNER